MKVLVIGGGGREHAIVWALRRSPQVTGVLCAPGNAGIAQLARCVPVDSGNLAAMVALVQAEAPALTVVGPEVPLALGLVDALSQLGFRVFGPSHAAARLETSKSFAKAFMQRHGIPTAKYTVCQSMNDVRRELPRFSVPVVVKADGLAAGKGVVICQSHAEAEEAAAQMLSGELLGKAEGHVVLEEFLAGEELSFFALCDGTHAVALAAAQDHKRIGEGDTGPNTGGMGAYTADGLLAKPMEAWLLQHVAQAVVDGMAREGTPFRGILFCGVMMIPATSDGASGTSLRGPSGAAVRPMVLEFNTRFGDPETQAILLRLETDFVDLCEAAIDGTADRLAIRMKPGASVCIIAASAGYPGKVVTGVPITGLPGFDGLAGFDDTDVVVFHSGTAYAEGQIVTAGGRVLGVTAACDADASGPASALQLALGKAYAAMDTISFAGMQYRRDIGWRALRDRL